MTSPITIQVDDAQVQAWFDRLLARGQNLSPLMADFGEMLLESTQQRFLDGKSPEGIAWAAVKRGGRPLFDTGTMRDQIAPVSGADFVELRATARQAAFHQFGTKPYTIRPKGKKALAWPGGPGPRKKVNHPGLVPRPFMGLSDEDRRAMDDLVERYLAP